MLWVIPWSGASGEVGFKLSFLLCCHSTAIIYGSHVAPLLFSPPQPHLLYLETEAIWQVQLREWRKAIALPHTLCFSSAKAEGAGKADAEALLRYGWTEVFVLWGTWFLVLGEAALLGPSRHWGTGGTAHSGWFMWQPVLSLYQVHKKADSVAEDTEHVEIEKVSPFLSASLK